MQHLDARIASFKPVLRPKSRAKPAFPLSPSEYPLLTPQNLAEAGFYHLADQPDLSYPDSCKCFTCGLHLGGWDADDNPHAEHWKRDNGCVWAQAVCLPKVEKRLRATNPLHRTAFFTEDSLPGSSKSAAMREATFGKWWPHKARSGIPTPKEMAQAGFLYYGSTDSQDCVLCPWCEYSADGWEAGDDPLEIHRSKSADCRFFTTVVEGTQEQAAESTSKTSRSTKPQTSNRSKRHTTAQVIPPESQDELASEAEVAEEERPASPEKPKRGTKARATTVKAKGGRGRKMAETVESEMDVTEDETRTLETRSVAPVEEGESQAPSTKSNGKPRKPRGTKASTKKGAADAVDVVPITTDFMSAPLPSTQVPGSVDAGTSGPSSQSSRPAGKPKSKPSKSTRPSTATSSKPAAASRQADDGEGKGEREEESTPRPLSQLDRFTNIPPSSPMPPPPTLKASRSSKQPTKKTAPSDQTIPIKTTTTSGPTRTPGPTTTPAPATTTTATTSTTARSNTLSRDVLNATLDNAAIRAAQVIINLPGTQPGPGTGAGGRGGVDAPAELESSSSAAAAAEAGGVQRRLSEEEMKMTLEEMVRHEYRRQYDEMKRQGEEMIRVWEQRAKEGRKRIQAI